MRHNLDLSSASHWSCRVGNFFQPISSTTQWRVLSMEFLTRFSDVISRENKLERREMSPVFSGLVCKFYGKNKELILNMGRIAGQNSGQGWVATFDCGLMSPPEWRGWASELLSEWVILNFDLFRPTVINEQT